MGTNRIAAGRYDTDSFTDLALLTNAGTSLNHGAYWLRNENGVGLSLSLIATTATGSAGKVVIVKGPAGSKDSVAALLSNGSLLGFSPYLPDAGTPSAGPVMVFSTASGTVHDISSARLPGWTQDGLVSTFSTTSSQSVVTTYPGFASGQSTSLTQTVARQWKSVASWRNWLMLATAQTTASHAVTFPEDGGISLSPSLASGIWKAAQEVDLLGDGVTQFFMETSSYTLFEFPPGMPPSIVTPAQAVSVARVDGGLPLGNAFAIGPYGPSLFGTSLFTLPDAGGVRQYRNFQKIGTSWRVDEVDRTDIANAGVPFVQAVLADMNGDAINDLVLLEKAGNIRIYFSPP